MFIAVKQDNIQHCPVLSLFHECCTPAKSARKSTSSLTHWQTRRLHSRSCLSKLCYSVTVPAESSSTNYLRIYYITTRYRYFICQSFCPVHRLVRVRRCRRRRGPNQHGYEYVFCSKRTPPPPPPKSPKQCFCSSRAVESSFVVFATVLNKKLNGHPPLLCFARTKEWRMAKSKNTRDRIAKERRRRSTVPDNEVVGGCISLYLWHGSCPQRIHHHVLLDVLSFSLSSSSKVPYHHTWIVGMVVGGTSSQLDRVYLVGGWVSDCASASHSVWAMESCPQRRWPNIMGNGSSVSLNINICHVVYFIQNLLTWPD